MNQSLKKEYRHFHWFDLIRFISAFIVLAGHLRGFLFVDYSSLPHTQQNPATAFLFLVTRLGHEAVLVFFVLSGYLVGGRTIEKINTKTFHLRQYAVDRFVRLALPLISALVLIILLKLLLSDTIDWGTIWGNFFFLHGLLVPPAIDPLWSLSYEAWFYIFMGALAAFFTASTSSPRYYSLIILLVCLLVFTKLKAHYLGIWTLGAIIYQLPVNKSSWRLLLWAGFTIVFLVLLQLSSESNAAVRSNQTYVPDRPVLEILFSAFLGFFLNQVIAFEPKRKLSILLDKWGTTLAKSSYTLYLVHFPIISLLLTKISSKQASINIKSVSLYFFYLAICLTGSYLIYLVAEKRTGEVKAWLNRVISRKQR